MQPTTEPGKDTVISIPKRFSVFSKTLSLFVLAHFAHHLLPALPVPLLAFIREDFGLNYIQAGLVVSAFSLAYGLGQLPAGWLADRIGRRLLLTTSISGVGLAGLLVGLSPSYVVLLVFLVVMGVAGGGYHPSAVPLISTLVEPKKRGQALGFHMIGGSGSFFLSPLIAAAIAAAWGWRGSFIGLSVPTILFGIIFYLLLGRLTGTSQAQPVISDHHQEPPSPPGRLRRLIAFIILSLFTQAVSSAAIAFVPLFLVDHFAASEKTAAVFVAITYSAGIWAGPLGGYLSDRLGRVPIILAISFMAGPIIYLLNVVPYGLGIGALLLTLGMVIYIRMPVSEAYIFGQTPERNRSMIFGIYYFLNMEAGGLLTPIMGSFIERFGFYSSFTIAGAALLAVTLLCSVFLWGSRD